MKESIMKEYLFLSAIDLRLKQIFAFHQNNGSKKQKMLRIGHSMLGPQIRGKIRKLLFTNSLNLTEHEHFLPDNRQRYQDIGVQI